MTADVEVSDDMFIITKDTAEAYPKNTHVTTLAPTTTPNPTVATPPTVDPAAEREPHHEQYQPLQQVTITSQTAPRAAGSTQGTHLVAARKNLP